MKYLLITLSILVLASHFTKAQEKIIGDSISVKPITEEVAGELSEYFEVINKVYKIPTNAPSSNRILTVELKRKDKKFEFNVNQVSPFGVPKEGAQYYLGFFLDIIYAEGHVISSDPLNGGGALILPYNNDDILSLLGLKKGETASVRWKIDDVEQIQSFRLKSILRRIE